MTVLVSVVRMGEDATKVYFNLQEALDDRQSAIRYRNVVLAACYVILSGWEDGVTRRRK